MPDQQISVVSACTNMADGRQDHNIGYEAAKTEVMKRSQKSREVKYKLGQGA